MANIDNVNIGVCSVKFNNVDLGHTKDGVEVEYAKEVEDLTVDQYGSTPVDKVITGESIKATVKLAEDTLANLLVAIPGASLQTGGNGSRLAVGQNAGALLSTYAKELVLHPNRYAAADESHDVVIYKAVATELAALSYKIDEQKVFEITFEGLIDETKDAGNRLFHIGTDPIS